MKLSKTINISSGGEGGSLDRHEMAIFQCKDWKRKFILFFSDKNSTAELISVHRIPELIRCLIFYTTADTRQHAGSDRLRMIQTGLEHLL